MLCVEIMKINSRISDVDWNYFTRGAAGVSVTIPPKPDAAWLQPSVWNEACTLDSVLPAFKGLAKDLIATPVWVESGNVTVSREIICYIKNSDITASNNVTNALNVVKFMSEKMTVWICFSWSRLDVNCFIST